MKELIAVLILGVVIIAIGLFVVRKEKNSAFLFAYVVIGTFAVSLSAFELGGEILKGTPLSSIEPGKYTVVGIVDKEFAANGQRLSTGLLLQNEGGDVRFYLLPTEELVGVQKKGGTLEVAEVPSSKKMVLHE